MAYKWFILQVSIEYLDGQTFADGRSMMLPGCHADAADVLELLRMLERVKKVEDLIC